MDPREEKIRNRAQELWEQSGKPEGTELDFWFQAGKVTEPAPTSIADEPE